MESPGREYYNEHCNNVKKSIDKINQILDTYRQQLEEESRLAEERRIERRKMCQERYDQKPRKRHRNE